MELENYFSNNLSTKKTTLPLKLMISLGRFAKCHLWYQNLFYHLKKVSKIKFHFFFTSKTTLLFNKSSKKKSLFGNMDFSLEPCGMFLKKVVAMVKTPPVGKGSNHSIPYPVLKPYIFSFFSQIATVHHCKGLHSAG